MEQAQWILENWTAILATAAQIVAAASIIANFTPSETDNKIVDILKKIINLLAINIKVGK